VSRQERGTCDDPGGFDGASGSELAGAGPAGGSGSARVAGAAGGALARALERWRRVVAQGRERPPAAGPAAGPAVELDSLMLLARRLDDSGCAYGRVSAARVDDLTRAYDRLETKLNAILMAVTGTFLSTLAGLFLYYVRGGGQ
jgi:hypothetical protein